jgi:hypothetical protein
LSIAGRPSGARLPAAIDALSPIADALGTIADIGPVRSLTQPLAAATWTLVGIAESLLEVRIVVARALAMRRIVLPVLDAGAAVDVDAAAPIDVAAAPVTAAAPITARRPAARSSAGGRKRFKRAANQEAKPVPPL